MSPELAQTSSLSPEQLLALAAQAGAEAAEVYQTESLTQPVVFETNRLKQIETSQAEGTALRLWHQGRPGLAVAYGAVEPQLLVEKALTLSQLNSPETPELTAGDSQQFAAVGETIAVKQLIAYGESAIAQIRDAYPEAICAAELACEQEQTRIVNSLGLDYRFQDITLSGYVDAEWIRGDDFLNVGDGQVDRHQLKPDAIAADIIQRLAWAKQSVAPPQGQVPVVFTAKAADLLWDTLCAALNGKRIAEGASPWSERLGQTVIAEPLSLRQDPTAGPYSCPFDDEGTLIQPVELVSQGVMRGVYCDLKIGRQLGLASTGNGFRPGLGGYPQPSLLNLIVEPESLSWEQMIGSLDDAIVIDQVLGNSGGLSGELSVNLELGYRVRQGHIVGRVKDTMIAGNVYTALKHLIGLGSDSVWNGSTYTPSVAVNGLSVTGS
ncbi:TldD/PmbA family protein [Romeria aff. gracilis LEGE 07310]|uniref:TldD/PmbA family protein n=1 Tax=Vasconcelosia minhoensis LEGE 07310 TaxID=915328 RepID=A0A8J7ALG5_9CYAN|nr:metallopeptidase TldD-related protein [Romeria gracilis]MBE9076366.1 TldD/PmbA family protein [Romeria aff. gracilis LEGE 07310]